MLAEIAGSLVQTLCEEVLYGLADAAADAGWQGVSRALAWLADPRPAHAH
jgi:hypothetical protein